MTSGEASYVENEVATLSFEASGRCHTCNSASSIRSAATVGGELFKRPRLDMARCFLQHVAFFCNTLLHRSPDPLETSDSHALSKLPSSRKFTSGHL